MPDSPLDNGCCNMSGGRIIITLNGKRYHSRGDVELMPTNTDTEVGVNDDGTLFTTKKAVPAQASFTLSDECGLNIFELMSGCKIDATFDQIDMRRKWLYTQGTVVGRPTINSGSGAIAGIRLASGQVSLIPY